MTLLILGVALWWITHTFPLVARPSRDAMAAAIGENPYKGVFSLVTLGVIALIVVGYRAAPVEPVYAPPGWGVHLNNLLMLLAVALLGAGHSKGNLKRLVRHPMLLAVATWAVAHLLVNGDVASLILFGGMGVWAVAAIFATNARDGAWQRPAPGTRAGDLRHAVITVVVFAVIAGLHSWAGYYPFPS